MLEVSLVRKGARQGCHILAYQEEGRPVVVVGEKGGAKADAWAAFDLGV